MPNRHSTLWTISFRINMDSVTDDRCFIDEFRNFLIFTRFFLALHSQRMRFGERYCVMRDFSLRISQHYHLSIYGAFTFLHYFLMWSLCYVSNWVFHTLRFAVFLKPRNGLTHIWKNHLQITARCHTAKIQSPVWRFTPFYELALYRLSIPTCHLTHLYHTDKISFVIGLYVNSGRRRKSDFDSLEVLGSAFQWIHDVVQTRTYKQQFTDKILTKCDAALTHYLRSRELYSEGQLLL